MSKMLLGAFDNMESADQALYELEHFGFEPTQISVISSKSDFTKQSEHSDTTTGAIKGAKAGTAIGGLAGLMAGAGLVPAIAGLFFAGPVVAALGLAGVVGATAAGALSGAAAGGLIGALTKAGVSKDTAETYASVVEDGGVVIGVTHTEMSQEAAAIFEKHGARDVTYLDMHDPMERTADESDMRYAPSSQYSFGEKLDDTEE